MKLTPRSQQLLTKFSQMGIGRFILRLGAHAIVPRHRIGVAIVAFNETDDVLLLKHVFQHEGRIWGLPGGWLNKDEDPIEGGLRELREETGLSAVSHTVVHAVRKKGHIAMSVLATVENDTNDLRFSGEIYEARWTPLNELPNGLQDFARESIKAGYTQKQLMQGVTV